MRESDVQKPPGIAEAIDWLAALELLGVERLDVAAVERTLGVGAQVQRGPGGDPRGRPRAARATVTDARARSPSRRSSSTCRRWSRRSARRLHDAGLPVTPARSAEFARALTLVRPVARRRLVLDRARDVRVAIARRSPRSTASSSRSSAAGRGSSRRRRPARPSPTPADERPRRGRERRRHPMPASATSAVRRRAAGKRRRARRRRGRGRGADARQRRGAPAQPAASTRSSRTSSRSSTG